jgi:glycine cleavage system H protein
LRRQESGLWRVGFTKFATRMLGEIVDHQWEKAEGEAVKPGEILGSIEGFKAISDLYCVAEGRFAGGNGELREKIALVGEHPYGEGWLYQFEGTPDANCVSVETYRDRLDSTIGRILEKQQASPDEHSP